MFQSLDFQYLKNTLAFVIHIKVREDWWRPWLHSAQCGLILYEKPSCGVLGRSAMLQLDGLVFLIPKTGLGGILKKKKRDMKFGVGEG